MNGVPPVIAVDGPGGSGKGTLGMRLAYELGWHYLDSGLLYRSLALAADRSGIASGDTAALERLGRDLELRFERRGEGDYVALLGDEDVSRAARSEGCARLASRLAAVPEVRRALLRPQRAYRRDPGLIADGRDMGTVVFPDAALKLFLVADSEERAARRHKQLKSLGLDAILPERLLAGLVNRDERDSRRAISPARPAEDAVIVDTTGRDAAAVFEQAAALVVERFPEATLRLQSRARSRDGQGPRR